MTMLNKNHSLNSCTWQHQWGRPEPLQITPQHDSFKTRITPKLATAITYLRVVQDCEHEGPHYGLWKKFAGRKERNSIAIRRLVCCSSRPNVCCTPNAMLDSRVIFTSKFSVSLFGTQNRDFLLEKGTQHTKKITEKSCFVVMVI